MKIGKPAGCSRSGRGRAAAMRATFTHAGAAILLAATLAGCGMLGGDEPPAAATSNESYPDLKSVPDKAPEATSLEDRKDIAEGLASDRKNAMYSDQVLRGGTEPPAPSPEVVKPTPVPELKDVPESSMEDADKQSKYDAMGTVPMPARGGHDSYAAIEKQSKDEDADTVASADVAPVPTGEAGESGEMGEGTENLAAAPTEDVDVAPAE